MLTEKQLASVATSKLIEIFGRQYLLENYGNTCKAQGFSSDNVFMFFVGIKSKKELPDREVNRRGWVVFGDVRVDATTGEVLSVDFELE